MDDYVKQNLEESKEDMSGMEYTPTSDNLFDLHKNLQLLDKETE